MKHQVTAALLLIAAYAHGQNLVPNGSFEEYGECPNNGAQIDRAIGWSAFRRSPDYYNSCDEGSVASVPFNFIGEQFAASGQAYAGIILWQFDGLENVREHFGAEMDVSLLPGIPVFISFKVVRAEGGTEAGRWAASGVGVRFEMEPDYPSTEQSLPNSAALHLDVPIVETVEWTAVTGMYVPDSAYRYIVVGNFFNDDIVNAVLVNPNGNGSAAYVFIDDVCVSYDPIDCAVELGIQEQEQVRFHIYPNPFTTEFRVSFNARLRTGLDVYLRDMFGRTVWTGQIQAGQTHLSFEGIHLPAGQYVFSGSSQVEVLPPVVVILVSP